MCWSFRPRRLNLQIAILRLSNYLSILLQESQLLRLTYRPRVKFLRMGVMQFL